MPSPKRHERRASRLSPTAPDLYVDTSPPPALRHDAAQQAPRHASPFGNTMTDATRNYEPFASQPAPPPQLQTLPLQPLPQPSDAAIAAAAAALPAAPPPAQSQAVQTPPPPPQPRVPVLTSIIVSAPPTKAAAATRTTAAAPTPSPATAITSNATTPPITKKTATAKSAAAAAVTGQPVAAHVEEDDDHTSVETQTIEVPTPRKKSQPRRASRGAAATSTGDPSSSAAAPTSAHASSRRDTHRTRGGATNAAAAAAAAAPISLYDRDYQDDPEGAAAAMRAIEQRLPRPDWYSSGDDETERGGGGGAGKAACGDAAMPQDELENTKSELRVRPDGNLLVLHVYTAMCILAFVFSLVASCPVPWLRAARGGRVYTLWRASGGGVAPLRVADIHDCSEEQQYWQATSAFSVLTTVTSFAAVIAAVLLCVNLGHLGACFALSFYGSVFALVAWALMTALYHYRRCDKGAFARAGARLDAGFALTFIAWVAHLVGLALLLQHFVRFYTRSVHSGKTHVYRFVHVALLCVVMLFYCLGPAYTQWSRSFDVVTVRVTMWHVEVHDKMQDRSTYLTRRAYQCTTLTRRMKVVAGFIIMAIIWLFFALMFAMRACYVAKSVRTSNLFAAAAALFAAVAWIVLLVVRHSHLCTGAVPAGASLWTLVGYNGIPTGVNNAQVRYDGYALGEGFGLIVAGWALNVVVTVLNCIF